ncbi:hypothetical protein C9374_002259 [Naegleria lovaniensis]|uniref:C2 domain-containing protein n=1 Tax=Naegleria lovaniensis TaxID=51637 RepID=A0AA88KK85_NAELO|nr:uncharacterized protein C9374_002259 [Naegleria lovaniensis]KAG2386515.1 hypothetical protein C9374_002259 [Naegleria lovaniensis]
MEFIRALKKRKANPPSTTDEGSTTTTSDNTSSNGSFFYNLFFGSPSKSNKSASNIACTSSKKRTQDHGQQDYYHSSSSEDEEENKENQQQQHSTTKKKKRTTSKYPHLKKQRDEIKKMKDSIQSLGSSDASKNLSNATLGCSMTSKENLSSLHSTTTTTTPQSRGKKKSLLGHLFSFTSANDAESPQPIQKEPLNSPTCVGGTTFVSKISEMTKQDLDRMKGVYRSPLYTNTPPKPNRNVMSPLITQSSNSLLFNENNHSMIRELVSPSSILIASNMMIPPTIQTHSKTLDSRRKSTPNESLYDTNPLINGMMTTNTSNSHSRSSMESIPPILSSSSTQHSLSREQSSSSGFSTHSLGTLSSSHSSGTTPCSNGSRPLSIHYGNCPSLTSTQQLLENVPQFPYVFNLILFRGSKIKNSGNGFKDHSNVYAVVEVGNHKKTSSVIKNSSNPVWNEQFQLMFSSPVDPFDQNISTGMNRSVVSIRLYDHDDIFEHEFLGKVEIPLHDLIVQCGHDTGKFNGNGQLIMKRSSTIKEVVKLQNVECGQIEIQYRVEHHVKKTLHNVDVVKYNFF